MDERLLTKLLCEKNEKDWLEFKGKSKTYQSDGTLGRRHCWRHCGFIIGGARLKAEQVDVVVSDTLLRTMFVIIGVVFGEAVGCLAASGTKPNMTGDI